MISAYYKYVYIFKAKLYAHVIYIYILIAVVVLTYSDIFDLHDRKHIRGYVDPQYKVEMYLRREMLPYIVCMYATNEL